MPAGGVVANDLLVPLVIEDLSIRDVAGVGVQVVIQGSAAERAGLVSARYDSRGRVALDVIQAVNGHQVTSREDLFDVLDRLEVGDEVRLKVLRGSQVAELPVVLQEVR